MSYLDELTTTLRNTHLEKLFSFQPPAVVLSRGMQPLSEMMQYGKNCEYKEFFVSGIYNVLAAQGARIAGFACDLHLPFGTPDEYRTAEKPENRAGFDALG